MYWPYWYILNRKRFLYIALLVVILLLAIWFSSSLFSGFFAVDNDLFGKAMSNTLACSSYRYSVEVKQGGRDVLTMVQGERAVPNRIHLTGTMQKSQMEFIQIEDVTYMKDPWSDRWFTLKGNSIAQSELFIAEFNPLGLFTFKDVPVIKSIGNDKVDGMKTVVLELKTIVSNPFLELKYTDFKFRVWVDKKEKLIRKAVMQGYLPGGEEGLAVDMKFWDFNEKISINPPQGTIMESR